jgi:hypothetical protein
MSIIILHWRGSISDNAKLIPDDCRYSDDISLTKFEGDYFLAAGFLAAFRKSSALVCFRRCWRRAIFLPLFISINLPQINSFCHFYLENPSQTGQKSGRKFFPHPMERHRPVILPSAGGNLNIHSTSLYVHRARKYKHT